MRHRASRFASKAPGHPSVVAADLVRRVDVERGGPLPDQLVTADAAEDESAVLVDRETVGKTDLTLLGTALRAQRTSHGP